MIRKILMGLAAVVGFTTAATATTPIVTVDGDNVTVQNTTGNAGGYSWTNPTGNWVCIPSAAELEAGSYVKVKSFQFWSKGSMNSNQYADRVCLQANGVTYVSDMYSGSTAGDQPLTYSFAEGNEPVLQVGKTNRVSFVLADDKTGLRFRAGEKGCGSDGFFQVGSDANYAPQLILTAEKVAEPPAPVYESVLSLNFNASNTDRTVPADTDPGAIVNDSNWYNFTGASAEDQEAGTALVSYNAPGTYNKDNRIPAYLKGYFDDHKGGVAQTISITVSNLKTAPYDVYIYCNSDNASGWNYKTVNGKDYTADATGTGVSGTGAWGNNNNLSEVLGKNVMVVKNVYPDADGTIAISSTRNGSYRGCIAAIQICENPAAPTYEAEIDEETDWKDIDWDPSKPEGGFEDDAVLKLKVNGKTTLMFSEILNIPQRLEINDDGENALTLKAADALFTDGCYEKTIATFGSFVPGCAKVPEELPAGFSGEYTLTDSGFKVRAQNREVISINIGGGKLNNDTGPIDSPEANLVPADQNYYGVAPTMGETWNNIGKQWKNTRSTVTLEGSKAAQADGTVVERPTIDLSATATTTWQADITNPFLRGYLDDGDGLEVAVHGVPYTKYDVIVYATSDATSAVLSPITVNGEQYTFVDGETVKGSTIWGKALCNVPAIGDNALYIKDCTGEQLTISAAKTTGGRGTLCAVQVICQGDIEIRHEYYGEMCGDVCFTDGEEDENLEKLGDSWENGPLNTITISNTAENATFSFGAETIGQQIKFVSDYPMTIDAASMVEYGKLGIYDFTEVEGGVTIKLPNEAFDVSTLPTTIKGDWKFSKDGLLVFDGKLPPDSYKTFFTNETDWAGTVWIKNFAVGGQVFNEYGNANSKLRFTGVKGWFNYNTNETTLPIELVDEDDTLALEVTDGSLNKSYIFDKVTSEEGVDASINVSSVHDDAFIVQIKDVSEYYGKITSLASTTPKGDETKPFPILIGEMEGALPYGTTSKITVADGAAINLDCGWEAESVAFGATLMLMSGAEGGQIVSGLEMEEPVYLATKVMYPESNPNFSCLGYEDGGIWIRKAVAFSIKDCDNTTFTVEGAFYQETGPFTAYYYAAKGAPVKVTYTTNEGYFFSDGTTTKVVETTVEEDMWPIEVEDEAKPYVAKVGDECFESLNDAFENAAYGDTIFLLQNASIEKSIDLVYDEGYYWDCTLDMNGKTITPGYNPSKDAYKPMFNVSSNATLTITGNGTIAGWDGALGKEYDGKAVINVDGGFLYYLNGTLTAGGQGSDGMYGVYVCGSGTARFGENGVEGGPSITTWFAAIGANNTNPGKLGVDIIVYGGEYTQLADGTGQWWDYFCAAIYAPANGKYDIKGGTFTGALYSFSTRYANVDQDVWFYGGTYNQPLFIDEQKGQACEGEREIWKADDVTLNVVPDGYVWDGRGYLMPAACAVVKLDTEFYYATLQEAFNVVMNGETVKMLKDITITNGIDLVYDEGYAWYCTFDMNGKTLTAKYDRDAATCKPVFNVSSNAFFTITGNGTIAGWTGAEAAKYDGNAVIEVDGGFLYYLNGTLTAGGEGDSGMYGVYVLGSGKAEFGTNGGVGTTGPTIETWFAAIGANNTTPGVSGVTVWVYEGTFTQLADGKGQWWDYFCSAIYAPAKGTYEIKGGTFNGTVGSIALPYNNVGQAVRIEAGTFVKTLYVGEKTATVGGGERLVWKDDKVILAAPTGYAWDEEGYLVKSSEPIVPGGEIVVPEGQAEALAESINDDPEVKAQYLKAPGDVETTDDYRSYFDAVATSGTTVKFFLNETGTNAVVEATDAAKVEALDVALSEGSELKIDEPLVGFYYSLKQGDDVKKLGFNDPGDQDKLAGKDTIKFMLKKSENAGFYQTIITPVPTKVIENAGAFYRY